MKHKYFLLIVISFSQIFFACNSKKTDSEGKVIEPRNVSLSGAFALYPLANQWADEYNKANPDKIIKFEIQAGGAGKGLADAIGGIVDLGMFSREITQAEKERGVWWVAVTKDAVVPTISAKNPALDLLKKRGLTQKEFCSIFIDGSLKYWNKISGINILSPIKVFTRSDACGAADTWAAFFDKKQEDLKGIGVFGDPGLADAVIKEPAGIAYNNIVYAYDIKTEHKRPGIEIIPIDINSNGKIDVDENFYENIHTLLASIATGKYPSPPARELYFVAKEKPTNKAVIDFLYWVLNDGQKFVVQAGYVNLDENNLKNQLVKLK